MARFFRNSLLGAQRTALENATCNTSIGGVQRRSRRSRSYPTRALHKSVFRIFAAIFGTIEPARARYGARNEPSRSRRSTTPNAHSLHRISALEAYEQPLSDSVSALKPRAGHFREAACHLFGALDGKPRTNGFA